MRSTLPPILLLALLAGFAFWNARAVSGFTERWLTQLDQAAAQADAADWTSARETLSSSYTDWQSHCGYLRITANHSTVNAAESMYCRALAFAETEELTEFRAEVAGLRSQLLLMAETERFHPENIL